MIFLTLMGLVADAVLYVQEIYGLSLKMDKKSALAIGKNINNDNIIQRNTYGAKFFFIRFRTFRASLRTGKKLATFEQRRGGRVCMLFSRTGSRYDHPDSRRNYR